MPAAPRIRETGAAAVDSLSLTCAGVPGADSAPDRVQGPSPWSSRSAAIFLSILLALAVVLSSLTVAEDFHHRCTGDGCVVCAQISACLHLARDGATLAGAIATPGVLTLSAAPLVLGEERVCLSLTTLVALKVQLND